MCGLIGQFSYAAPPREHDGLLDGWDALRHRGPDRAGLWTSHDRRVTMAFRRLAIIDLSSAADQPMASNDGSLRLVCNGEIYNHEALRKELIAEGCRFHTANSDTEVILNAYAHWGIESVSRLRGMFAFALWDAARQSLWLVRDRAGVKPLYFADDAGRLVFASEIGPLIRHMNVPSSISGQGVYDFLTFLTVPAPRTMFRNVRKVEAGTWVHINAAGTVTTNRYWNAADYLNDPLADDDRHAAQGVDGLIEEAITLTTCSDVPLAATLSGGVDSSLVVATLQARGHQPLAIVIDYERTSAYNEAAAARHIARRLGVELLEHIVSDGELEQAINESIEHQLDLPAGAPDAALLLLVACAARANGRIVCILGEGADELGGYPSYLDLPAAVVEPGRDSSRARAMLAETAPRRRHVQSFSEEEKTRMWRGGRVSSSYDAIDGLADEIRVDTDDRHLRAVSNVEFKLRLPEFMLARVDYSMMRASVEGRVPFLDHRLVELMLRLPFSLKIKRRQPKYLIRRALARYLGEDGVPGGKIGFGRVLTPFLVDVLPAWIDRDLRRPKARPLYDYVDESFVRELYERRHSYPNAHFKMWTLYSLARWLEAVG
jgi:asparagine synthase (glutamine-hydrolysing)